MELAKKNDYWQSLESKVNNSKVEEKVIKLDLSSFKDLIDLKEENDDKELEDKPVLVSYVRGNLGKGIETYSNILGDLELKSSYKQILDEDKKGVYVPTDNDDEDKESVFSEVKSEVMTREEAEEKIKDIQYAQILGSSMDVDPMTRRKVANWIMFNPALFNFFESNYGITRDVDYSKFI